MALKGDRYEGVTVLAYFLNEDATRGGIATLSTAGSGAGLDQSAALVSYTANGSGKQPIGILLNDSVSIDQTRQHINYQKNEMIQGGKCTLLKQGWVLTDYIDPGVTVAAGDIAYVGPSGRISNSNALGGRVIGDFATLKDEDGYATVNINVPQKDPNN